MDIKKLSHLLDEVGNAAIDYERDRNEEAEKVYEARKKAVIDFVFEPKQQINFYRVYNGYQGYEPVHVEVFAANEERAFEMASKAFKEDSDKRTYNPYPSRYWTNLEINFITETTRTEESIGEVMD